MKRSQLKSFIGLTQGEPFWVEFVKRTDSTLRIMQCKTGIHTDPASVSSGRKFDPNDHQLAVVWSVGDGGYRSVPLDAVVRIKFRGVWELVTGDTLILADLKSQHGKMVDCYCRCDGLDRCVSGVLTVASSKFFVDEEELLLEGVHKIVIIKE